MTMTELRAKAIKALAKELAADAPNTDRASIAIQVLHAPLHLSDAS